MKNSEERLSDAKPTPKFQLLTRMKDILYATSSFPVRLVKQILRLVDFTCKVRRAAAVRMVSQHDMTVSILESLAECRSIPVDKHVRNGDQRSRMTHLRPRIAMASLRSILALNPPFTHWSAAPFPITPLRMRCLPTSAAVTAPRPTMTGVAMFSSGVLSVTQSRSFAGHRNHRLSHQVTQTRRKRLGR